MVATGCNYATTIANNPRPAIVGAQFQKPTFLNMKRTLLIKLYQCFRAAKYSKRDSSGSNTTFSPTGKKNHFFEKKLHEEKKPDSDENGALKGRY